MTCRKTNSNLTDLLLDPQSAPAALRKHVAECADCASELAAMQATMKVLDEWPAPEPGAFFDARLQAKLRSEATSSPAGFLERLKDWVLYSSNFHAKPWAAGALATVLAIGGGTFVLLDHQQPAEQASATVRDLQSYDGNAQLFQQLNSLDVDDAAPADTSN
jgi:anti-sigma factor RsiW